KSHADFSAGHRPRPAVRPPGAGLMVLATLYIMRCSAKNRLRRRLQRLREPRYLIGAVVGVAYFVFALRGRTGARRATSASSRGSRPVQNLAVTLMAAAPPLAGLALLVAAAVSWVMPFGSGLLEFTQAETAFQIGRASCRD